MLRGGLGLSGGVIRLAIRNHGNAQSGVCMTGGYCTNQNKKKKQNKKTQKNNNFTCNKGENKCHSHKATAGLANLPTP
jgi:hypothetical protein